MTVLTMTTYQMFLDSVEDELVDRRRVRPNCPRPEKLLTFQLVASRVFSTKKTFQFSTSQYHPPRKPSNICPIFSTFAEKPVPEPDFLEQLQTAIDLPTPALISGNIL